MAHLFYGSSKACLQQVVYYNEELRSKAFIAPGSIYRKASMKCLRCRGGLTYLPRSDLGLVSLVGVFKVCFRNEAVDLCSLSERPLS